MNKNSCRFLKRRKKMLIVYHDNSQIVGAMTRIKEIRFPEKKTKRFGLLDQFRHKKQVQIQPGSISLPTAFLQTKISLLLYLSSLLDKYFQKQLPFSRREKKRPIITSSVNYDSPRSIF